jgi:hypothetical protein
MPRGFWFPNPSVRIWMPEPLTATSRSNNSTLIGRVGPGQDVRAMEAPVAQLVAMLDERFDYPVPRWDKTKDPRITPVRDDVLGPMRPALRATLGAIALILLIGCANVAALVLGQVNARSTETVLTSHGRPPSTESSRPAIWRASGSLFAGAARSPMQTGAMPNEWW